MIEIIKPALFLSVNKSNQGDKGKKIISINYSFYRVPTYELVVKCLP